MVPEGRFATANIDLRQLGAALEGIVTVNGLPRIGHSVSLTPVGAASESPLMTHEAWTGSSGGYGFPGVPPGRYVAVLRSGQAAPVLAEVQLSLPRGHTRRHNFDIRRGQ